MGLTHHVHRCSFQCVLSKGDARARSAEVLPSGGEYRRFSELNRSTDPFRSSGARRGPKIPATTEPSQKRGSSRLCCLLAVGPRTSGPFHVPNTCPFRCPRITEGVCNPNESYLVAIFSAVANRKKYMRESKRLEVISQREESNLSSLFNDNGLSRSRVTSLFQVIPE